MERRNNLMKVWYEWKKVHRKQREAVEEKNDKPVKDKIKKEKEKKISSSME